MGRRRRGDYRWYVKGEQDTRKRFMNQREMMLLFGSWLQLTALNSLFQLTTLHLLLLLLDLKVTSPL